MRSNSAFDSTSSRTLVLAMTLTRAACRSTPRTRRTRSRARRYRQYLIVMAHLAHQPDQSGKNDHQGPWLAAFQPNDLIFGEAAQSCGGRIRSWRSAGSPANHCPLFKSVDSGRASSMSMISDSAEHRHTCQAGDRWRRPAALLSERASGCESWNWPRPAEEAVAAAAAQRPDHQGL